MSDNDLISRSHFDDRVRLAAGPDADLEYSADFLDGIKVVLYMLGNEPPVPQEMSAREYIGITYRMLVEDERAWDNLVLCEEKGDAEKSIMLAKRWAAEHFEERSE